MTERIATYSTTTNLLNQAIGLQAEYSRTQLQSSSGLKSEHYSGISLDSGRLLNLESQFSSLSAQVAAMKSAQTRLDATQDVTSDISTLLETINSQLTISLDGTQTSSAAPVLGSQAQTWLTEMSGLLNKQYAGNYLFGGSMLNATPVNLSDPSYLPLLAPSTPITTYYQGDSTTQSVRVSSSVRINYGVTADNPAFEKIFRALSLVVSNPGDTPTLNQAFDLIKTASTEVADITATLSSKGNILLREVNTQSATLDALDTSISDLRDVDITQTAVKLSTIETQLQASYTTLTTLLKLSLSDYVR